MADIPRDAAGAVAGDTLRVLFLEDSEDDVELTVRGLRRDLGPVSFSRVETPEELRRAASLGPWDLVISDHSMPRLTLGLAVEGLRGGAAPLPPILVVSGHLDRSVEAEARRAGAAGCFPKSDLPGVVAAAARLLAPRRGAPAGAPGPAWAALPDGALRDAAVAGRDEAWAELRRRFRPAILSGAARGLRASGAPVRAAEVEETECRVWARLFARGARNLRLSDPRRGGLRARLYGLAEREGWSQARRERRGRAAGSRPPEFLALLPSRRDEDPGRAVLAGELEDLTRAWLAFRPREEARLLELRAAGRSLSEIAEETGHSRSKVQRRLDACERELRARLAAWGWDAPGRR
ncbi:MAG: hypothetical protein L0216_19130 [Planctomycetales bacterium]|nr:hypothetical protein [Planctomycetales bacterium]